MAALQEAVAGVCPGASGPRALPVCESPCGFVPVSLCLLNLLVSLNTPGGLRKDGGFCLLKRPPSAPIHRLEESEGQSRPPSS